MESDFRKAIDADHAVNHRNAQEFTIAHSAYISLALRQKIRNIQKAKFPHLQLGFRILFALDLFEALDSGQVQAGVTFAPLGRQDFTHILCDPKPVYGYSGSQFFCCTTLCDTGRFQLKSN